MNKNGRPTVLASNGIRDTLLKYYEADLLPYYVAQKTGYNPKTVYKYYNEFTDEIKKSEMDDFIERHDRDRIQTIISYDSQIDDARIYLSQVASEIETYVKEKKPIPRYLYNLRLELMKFKLLLVKEKTSFVMHLAMDSKDFEKKVGETMEENDKTKVD